MARFRRSPQSAEGPWRTVVRAAITGAVFAEPVAQDRLDAAGRSLGWSLPDDLASLLLETDGVTGAHGLNLIWPVDRIVEHNLAFRGNAGFRDLYMSFEQLLFFGDAGNGDQFAFPCLPERDHEIFVWNHENDSRTWAAPRLRTFFEWWGSGRLTV